jgi:hypothetical protein
MEGDARFGYENEPIDTLISKARAVIKCNEKLKQKKETKISKKPESLRKKQTKTNKVSKKTKNDGDNN